MITFIRICGIIMVADICFAAALSPVQAYTVPWLIIVGIPLTIMVVLALMLKPGGWSREAQNIEAIRKFEELNFIRRYENRKD